MQIQHYQAIQSTATKQLSSPTNIPAKVTQSQIPVAQEGVQVSISEQAKQLAQTDKIPSTSSLQAQPVPLPEKPADPLTGEKLEQAVQFKKAQMHYQATADMVNLVTGNGNGMSASSAYYLSNNEGARETVLETKAQQQNLANMQAYQEQTQALNEKYA